MKHQTPMGKRHRLTYVLSFLLLAGIAGCPHDPEIVTLEPVLPIQEAVEIVNQNNDGLNTGLQARGTVSGRIEDDEKQVRRFDLDANLLVYPPSHLRLDLQVLGDTQVLFGSNENMFWLFIKPEIDTYWYGRVDHVPGLYDSNVPLRSDMIIEALGIREIPLEWALEPGACPVVQRIDGEYQQILVVSPLGDALPGLVKEYWLERTDPRLVGQVLFRNHSGEVVMRSRLEDYRPLEGTESQIAHRIHVEWPKDHAEMSFSFSEWKVQSLLSTRHRAFVPPHERGETYSRMIDVDAQSGISEDINQ